ncbi:MAG TPA: peptidase U32 family protein [Candidatus Methanomethylophilaceae archaeon]|nr:peptidase U32 family protein [Candidatus Methanomethylophilaceae archaeon]
MEILAPAGSPEGLVAAIKGGCSAVYLGGKSYGARAFANNFTDQQLEGAVNYAHERDVKVYVTVNTLIKDSEMNGAVSFIKFLSDINVDAVLLQDVGLLKKIEDIKIAKHASTQMGIHSRAGLEWCKENGIDRAILARELTIEEIKMIIKDSPVETEAFVQGAMCYGMSGGCLFSSILGGRSGNRGQCAQPCRKKYKFGTKESYIMSCADIYGLDYIPTLKEIGLTSAKLEGRMRSPAYAYLASKVYSMKEKGEDDEAIAPNARLLQTIFNRGICNGYFGGVTSPVQSTYPDNRGYYLGTATIKNRSFVKSDLSMPLNSRDGISIFKGDVKIGGFKISDTTKITAPFKMPDDEYEIYRTYDPRIDEVKNIASSEPMVEGTTRRKYSTKGIVPDKVKRSESKADMSFYVNSIRNLEAVANNADRIYFELNDNVSEAMEICKNSNIEFVQILPRFDPYDIVIDSPVMVNNVGQMYANRKSPKVYGSYNMNMFNSFYPEMMHQTTLSVELNKGEIREITENYSGRLEVMVFGRLELLVTRDPKMINGILEDEKEFQFPIYRDSHGLSHLLNSSDLMLLDQLQDLQKMGIDSFGIDLRKRPAALAKLVSESFAKMDISKKSKISEMCGSTTNGHFNRGVS